MLQPPIGVYIWAFLASVNSPKTFRFRHRSSVRKPAAGNHQTAHNEGEHDFPCRDIAYHRKESALSEKIEARPYHGSENNHRMQPDKPPLEESPCSHLSPSVIVCIAYHESRKDEKEVHRQVAVVYKLICRT